VLFDFDVDGLTRKTIRKRLREKLRKKLQRLKQKPRRRHWYWSFNNERFRYEQLWDMNYQWQESANAAGKKRRRRSNQDDVDEKQPKTSMVIYLAFLNWFALSLCSTVVTKQTTTRWKTVFSGSIVMWSGTRRSWESEWLLCCYVRSSSSFGSPLALLLDQLEGSKDKTKISV